MKKLDKLISIILVLFLAITVSFIINDQTVVCKQWLDYKKRQQERTAKKDSILGMADIEVLRMRALAKAKAMRMRRETAGDYKGK